MEASIFKNPKRTLTPEIRAVLENAQRLYLHKLTATKRGNESSKPHKFISTVCYC